jgi:hypothetical protein
LLLHLPAPDLFLVSDVGFRWAYVQICWSIHGSKLYSRGSPSATADFCCSSICMVKLVADVLSILFFLCKQVSIWAVFVDAACAPGQICTYLWFLVHAHHYAHSWCLFYTVLHSNLVCFFLSSGYMHPWFLQSPVFQF